MAVPAAPVIRVMQDGSQCYVHWTAVTGATSYDVYATEHGVAALLGNTADTTYLTGNVICGPTTITVKAKNGDGDSAASNAVQKNLRGGDLAEPDGPPPGR